VRDVSLVAVRAAMTRVAQQAHRAAQRCAVLAGDVEAVVVEEVVVCGVEGLVATT
jgi:hypothetical protein